MERRSFFGWIMGWAVALFHTGGLRVGVGRLAVPAAPPPYKPHGISPPSPWLAWSASEEEKVQTDCPHAWGWSGGCMVTDGSTPDGVYYYAERHSFHAGADGRGPHVLDYLQGRCRRPQSGWPDGFNPLRHYGPRAGFVRVGAKVEMIPRDEVVRFEALDVPASAVNGGA